MTVYVGVGASRIHTWLTHTPKLTHLRGASVALSGRTKASVIDAWLEGEGRPGVKREPAAGDVDGVVALTAPDLATAEATALALLRHLRDQLPGVEWQAWWCEAQGYLDAMRKAYHDPESDIDRALSLPVLQDNGLVKGCLMCRWEAGASSRGLAPQTEVVHDDDPRAVQEQGPDCDVRDHCQQNEKHDRREGNGRWRDFEGAWPDDFNHLARKGGWAMGPAEDATAIGRRESRNHLATICADGNGVGSVVERLARSQLALDHFYGDFVRRLNETMEQAVIAATSAISDDGAEVAAAIPHYVGGDDCLVSVPAPLAWRFCAVLAGQFSDFRDTLLKDFKQVSLSLGVDGDQNAQELESALCGMSLGIGVVFAHSSHPFAETVKFAEKAMSDAKKAGLGKDSRIGWIDLTVESDAVLSGLGPAGQTIGTSLVEKQLGLRPGHDPEVDVFALTPSGRAQLTAILRDTPAGKVQKEIDRWTSRRANGKLHTTPDQLPAALSRARWWPKSSGEEDGK